MSQAISVPLDVIQACPAFAGLSDVELNQVAGLLEKVRVKTGEAIIREGESRAEKQGLFLLVAGQARVLKVGREIAQLAAPNVFGEIEFLTRMAPTATVVAGEGVGLYWIGREQVEERMREGNLACFKLLANLGRVLAQRLRATDEKIIELLAADKRDEFNQFTAKMLASWRF